MVVVMMIKGGGGMVERESIIEVSRQRVIPNTWFTKGRDHRMPSPAVEFQGGQRGDGSA